MATLSADTLKPIMVAQTKLFDGYMRLHFLSHINESQVPTDIMNLCHTFYIIDIYSICMSEMESQNTKHNHDNAPITITDDKLFVFAYGCFDNSEYFVSYKLVSTLIQIDGTESAYRFALACLLDAWNALDPAGLGDLYKKAIDLDPSHHTYKFAYAVFLSNQCLHNDALTQLTEASDLDQDNAEYILALAECCNQLKEFDKATIHYLKAIELAPKNAEYCAKYGRYLCEKLDDFEQSKLYFAKALEIDPEDLEICYEFAKLLRDYMKDYEESEKYYKKALEINDKDCGIYGSYGYLLYLQGDYKKAQKHILTALQMDNQYFWASYYLGLVQTALGKKTDATQSLKKSLEIISKFPKRTADTLKHLKVMQKADPASVNYHSQFEKLLNEKADQSITN
eukprot:76131_1